MVLTAPAGKVIGAVLAFTAVVVFVLLLIHYWMWVLAVLGISFLLALPGIRADRAWSRRIDEAGSTTT